VILTLGSLSIAIVIPQEKISLVSGLLDTFHFFFDAYKLSWIVPIIALLTAVGALGELNAWAIAGVKGLFVTTEYGCLPPIFHKINRHYTPVNLMIFQAVIVSLAAFVFFYMPTVSISYWLLSALSAQMYLMMYILLFIAGIVLRYTHPHAPRSYRVPFKNFGIWFIGLIGICSAILALTISFFPPLAVFTVDLKRYEIFIVIGFLVNFSIPLMLYSLRKRHWKI